MNDTASLLIRAGISPAMLSEAGARAAQRDADCTMVNARAGLTDTAKEPIKVVIHAGKMRAADIVQPETTPTTTP